MDQHQLDASEIHYNFTELSAAKTDILPPS